jgi:CubicO group peptidase (beta-lactamase class C family)
MQCGKFFAIAIAAGLLAAASASPAVGANEPSSTVKEYRLHMFDEPIRSLANRTIELMFNVARVEQGARTAALPEAITTLDFTYDFDGRTHPALDVLEDTHTDAMLILKDGRVVFESYLNRSDAKTHFNSYSMAKSINSILVGLAVADGRIHSVDDPILKYVPELKGSGYDGTTIKNLLEMRSGVEWDDNFFAADTTSHKAHVASWVEEKMRYADAAAGTRRAHQPGSVYNYDTMDAGVIGLVVERAVGEPISRYLSRRLWQPGGMQSYGFYVIDGPPGVGREFSGGGFNAVLRDYGRLGLLMQDEGRLNGHEILSRDYVIQSTRASTIKDTDTEVKGLGYAYFWWTVLGSRAYTALGGEGQFIYVDPATKTVIVKMSHGPVGPAAAAQEQEALSFFAAASRWPAEHKH